VEPLEQAAISHAAPRVKAAMRFGAGRVTPVLLHGRGRAATRSAPRLAARGHRTIVGSLTVREALVIAG